MSLHDNKKTAGVTDNLGPWLKMWEQSSEILARMVGQIQGSPPGLTQTSAEELLKPWLDLWQQGMRQTSFSAPGLGADVLKRGLPGMDLMVEIGRIWLDAASAAATRGPDAWVELLNVQGLERLQQVWRDRIRDWAEAVAPTPLGHGTGPALLKGLLALMDMSQVVGQRLTVPWASAYQELMAAWSLALRGDPEAFRSFVHRWRQAYKESHGKILRSPAMGATREYIERVSRSFDAYVGYLVALNEFSGILDKVGNDAARRWVGHVTAVKVDEGLPSFRDLYRLWLDIFEATYNEVFQTPEYSKLQARLVDSGLRFKSRLDRALEDFLKWMPITTESEIMELYKSFYELRREVRQQAAEIKRLKAQLADSAE